MKITDGQVDYIGSLIKSAIIKNTLAGFDKDGEKFKEYSTRPFKMFYSQTPNFTKLKKAIKENQAQPTIDGQGLKVIYRGGYKEFKQIYYPANNVNLHNTGSMLAAFTFLEKSQENTKIKTAVGEIEIPKSIMLKFGFTDETEAKKYIYNRLRGRDMLGLPSEQIEEIITDVLNE